MGGSVNDHASQPKRYGVLVASSRFPDEPGLGELACPENDVDGLHDILTDPEIGGFEDVAVIKNQPHHTALRAIHQALRKASREDLVLIFYAGHGKLDRAGRLHLATSNTVVDELETTSIPAHQISDLVDNADTGRITLVLDCCYSGAIRKSFLRGDLEEQLNIMAGGRGTFIMTASTDVQTAREDIRDGYGVFTKHIIEGIRSGEADANGDGLVTMDELYSYVHKHVKTDSHQRPMKWDLDVQGGDLVVARTGRIPREERRQAIRSRLFELANDGLIPDVIVQKGLEICNRPTEGTRHGAEAKYDALLDRMMESELRVGDFINDWLLVSVGNETRQAKASAREPAVEPARSAPTTGPTSGHERAPDDKPTKRMVDRLGPPLTVELGSPRVQQFWQGVVAPLPLTEENLHNSALYQLLHPIEVRNRQLDRVRIGEKIPTTGYDFFYCSIWLFAGFLVASTIIEPTLYGYYTPAFVVVVTLIWALMGFLLFRWAAHRLNGLAKTMYAAGFIGAFGFPVFLIWYIGRISS